MCDGSCWLTCGWMNIVESSMTKEYCPLGVEMRLQGHFTYMTIRWGVCEARGCGNMMALLIHSRAHELTRGRV